MHTDNKQIISNRLELPDSGGCNAHHLETLVVAGSNNIADELFSRVSSAGSQQSLESLIPTQGLCRFIFWNHSPDQVTALLKSIDHTISKIPGDEPIVIALEMSAFKSELTQLGVCFDRLINEIPGSLLRDEMRKELAGECPLESPILAGLSELRSRWNRPILLRYIDVYEDFEQHRDVVAANSNLDDKLKMFSKIAFSACSELVSQYSSPDGFKEHLLERYEDLILSDLKAIDPERNRGMTNAIEQLLNTYSSSSVVVVCGGAHYGIARPLELLFGQAAHEWLWDGGSVCEGSAPEGLIKALTLLDKHTLLLEAGCHLHVDDYAFGIVARLFQDIFAEWVQESSRVVPHEELLLFTNGLFLANLSESLVGRMSGQDRAELLNKYVAEVFDPKNEACRGRDLIWKIVGEVADKYYPTTELTEIPELFRQLTKTFCGIEVSQLNQ